MKKSIKKKWVAALRSGEYVQGQGALKRIVNRKPQFCCLGVLCDVLKNGKWVSRSGSMGHDFHFAREASQGMLPVRLRRKLGVKELDEVRLATMVYLYAGLRDREGIREDQATKLIRMNDEEGKSFREIADYIETNL